MENTYFASLELVMNDSFFLWVIQPDVDSDAYWHTWIQNNPQRRLEVERAKKTILQLYNHFKETEEREMPQKRAIWKRILDTVQPEDHSSFTSE